MTSINCENEKIVNMFCCHEDDGIDSLSFLSVATIKHCDQKHLGEERACLSSMSMSWYICLLMSAW